MVDITKHGWLTEDRSYYFVDMEYCPETLEDRIRSAGSGSANGPTLAQAAAVPQSISATPMATLGYDESISNKDSPSPPLPGPLENHLQFDINWELIGDILQDISSGLIYLHHNRIVHRNLKPRNGRQPIQFSLIVMQCSFPNSIIVGNWPTLDQPVKQHLKD